MAAPDPEFRFAHLSDPHFTEPRFASWREIANKRALSLLSWKLRRRHRYLPHLFYALAEDASHHAEHMVLTGDLTQAGLESECAEARRWLSQFEGSKHLCLIPGNHDSIRVTSQRAYWRQMWREWMAGGQEFPFLCRFGQVAFIGLSSAVPTPVFYASGRVDDAQLEALAPLLRECREQGLCRVLLVHHCPAEFVDSPRRGLSNAHSLRRLIEHEGAELVLHGHNHRWLQHSIAGPFGDVPVLSPPAASSLGTPEGRYRAGYYLISVRRGPRGWQIQANARELVDTATREIDCLHFEVLSERGD